MVMVASRSACLGVEARNAASRRLVPEAQLPHLTKNDQSINKEDCMGAESDIKLLFFFAK